jgi:hypothetical protein
MEEINNPNVETTPLNPVANNIEQQTEIKEPSPKKNILPLILIFIIVLLLGVIVYLWITNSTNSPSIENETKEEEKEENEGEQNETPEIPLKTFVYDNPKWTVGFTFQYPQNWEVTKNNTVCNIDPVSNEEICDSYELVLSLIENPKYFIDLRMCLECSPGFTCAYSDSNYTQEFMDNTDPVVFDSFEEFGNGKFRRSPKPSDLNGVLGDLVICKLETEGSNHFYSSCGIETVTSISYGLDDNVDERILKEMDSIMLTLERIDSSKNK